MAPNPIDWLRLAAAAAARTDPIGRVAVIPLALVSIATDLRRIADSVSAPAPSEPTDKGWRIYLPVE